MEMVEVIVEGAHRARLWVQAPEARSWWIDANAEGRVLDYEPGQEGYDIGGEG